MLNVLDSSVIGIRCNRPCPGPGQFGPKPLRVCFAECDIASWRPLYSPSVDVQPVIINSFHFLWIRVRLGLSQLALWVFVWGLLPVILLYGSVSSWQQTLNFLPLLLVSLSLLCALHSLCSPAHQRSRSFLALCSLSALRLVFGHARLFCGDWWSFFLLFSQFQGGTTSAYS